jgi:hypothetical protein
MRTRGAVSPPPPSVAAAKAGSNHHRQVKDPLHAPHRDRRAIYPDCNLQSLQSLQSLLTPQSLQSLQPLQSQEAGTISSSLTQDI